MPFNPARPVEQTDAAQMRDLNSCEQLLQKLCALEERQLQELSSLSTAISELAEANRAASEDIRKTWEAYDKSQEKYSKSLERANQSRVPALIIMAAIPVAIIVVHFL